MYKINKRSRGEVMPFLFCKLKTSMCVSVVRQASYTTTWLHNKLHRCWTTGFLLTKVQLYKKY